MLFYELTSLKDIFNEIMPEKVLDFCHMLIFEIYVTCLFLFFLLYLYDFYFFCN